MFLMTSSQSCSASGNCYSILYFYETSVSRFHIWLRSCSICSSVLLLLNIWFITTDTNEGFLFLWLNSIPLCVCHILGHSPASRRPCEWHHVTMWTVLWWMWGTDVSLYAVLRYGITGSYDRPCVLRSLFSLMGCAHSCSHQSVQSFLFLSVLISTFWWKPHTSMLPLNSALLSYCSASDLPEISIIAGTQQEVDKL